MPSFPLSYGHTGPDTGFAEPQSTAFDPSDEEKKKRWAPGSPLTTPMGFGFEGAEPKAAPVQQQVDDRAPLDTGGLAFGVPGSADDEEHKRDIARLRGELPLPRFEAFPKVERGLVGLDPSRAGKRGVETPAEQPQKKNQFPAGKTVPIWETAQIKDPKDYKTSQDYREAVVAASSPDAVATRKAAEAANAEKDAQTAAILAAIGGGIGAFGSRGGGGGGNAQYHPPGQFQFSKRVWGSDSDERVKTDKKRESSSEIDSLMASLRKADRDSLLAARGTSKESDIDGLLAKAQAKKDPVSSTERAVRDAEDMRDMITQSLQYGSKSTPVPTTTKVAAPVAPVIAAPSMSPTAGLSGSGLGSLDEFRQFNFPHYVPPGEHSWNGYVPNSNDATSDTEAKKNAVRQEAFRLGAAHGRNITLSAIDKASAGDWGTDETKRSPPAKRSSADLVQSLPPPPPPPLTVSDRNERLQEVPDYSGLTDEQKRGMAAKAFKAYRNPAPGTYYTRAHGFANPDRSIITDESGRILAIPGVTTGGGDSPPASIRAPGYVPSFAPYAQPPSELPYDEEEKKK